MAEIIAYDAGPAPVEPLSNLDAEQAFLGGVLVDNEVFHSAAFIRAEHFFDPLHGRIFTEIAKLIGAGRLADAVTLNRAIGAEPAMQEIGGTQYLSELVYGGATSLAAVEYAREVLDLSRRREVARIAEEMASRVCDAETETADEVIQDAEGQLYSLAEQGQASRGFVSFEEALRVSIETADAAFEHGGLSGLSTGLRDLDHKLSGLHGSDLVILAGRPSMGKTALATNMAYAAAKAGESVGFFSLEMSADQLANRILSDRTGIGSHVIRSGNASRDEMLRWREAARELADLPLHIDDTGGLNIATLSARARRLKRKHGLALVVVDYIQLCTASGMRSSANRVEEVSKITVGLKALAKEMGVPVLALSQLSRAVESRDDKRPQLSDLRESGSIEQDADVCLFVYREEYYLERQEPRPDSPKFLEWEDAMRATMGKAEVIIGKQRHGPLGAVKCAFNGATTRFSDLAEGQQ